MDPAPVRRLSSQRLFPAVGMPVHVNHPRHNGDTPLHDHDFLEIALVTDGHAVHRTVYGESPVRRGDLLVLHPGQWHAYEHCRGLRLYNCCIGVEVLSRELAWIRHDPSLSPLVPMRLPAANARPTHADQGVLCLNLTPDEARDCVAELERLRVMQDASDLVQIRPEVVARLLLVMGIIGHRLAATPERTRNLPHDGDQPILRVMETMEDHLDHPWGLAELAGIAGINRFHLVRQFHRHAGCPPMVWLLRRRAEKAAVLLLTTALPMAEIGRQVGWPDPNYFSRRFRAAFGISPREYRGQLPIPAQVGTADDWVQW